MTFSFNDEIMKDMSVMILNYTKICQHFNLTEEQMREVNAADKIIEQIRHYETFFLTQKATKEEPQQP